MAVHAVQGGLPASIFHGSYAIFATNRGIARARNSAVAAARSPAFLAFIDDDEVPHANWLDELMWTQSQFQADVVSGPVLPAYAADVRSGFVTADSFGGLFSYRLVVKLSSPTMPWSVPPSDKSSGFDEQFNLTGAEDSHFFRAFANLDSRWFSAWPLCTTRTEQRANLSGYFVAAIKLEIVGPFVKATLSRKIPRHAV
jgi:glycosyltransferase involved in cell wall biosynthesis